MEDLKRSRVTIVAVSAVVLFFLTNYLARFLFGLTGVVVSVVIAAVIAAYIGWSVARVLKRVPTSEERGRVLWAYGGFLGALFVAWGAYVGLSAGLDSSGVLFLLSHYLPYPALAHLMLSDRMAARFVGKAG
ncbi:hypothetical protein [Marinobacter salarius]|jgi:amino acid transporter|uniref:hypothetical protein n=1 Tax=Marinobacter salarius TaxID=1420917 RepID=UPI00059E45BC|nr:hypothetical protein [Marinobacter salarius]